MAWAFVSASADSFVTLAYKWLSAKKLKVMMEGCGDAPKSMSNGKRW
jgi:hypothetical protein